MFVTVVTVFGFLTTAQAAVYRYEFRNETMLQLSIGTPVQGPFKFYWYLPLFAYPTEGPYVPDKRFRGLFDHTLSKTFKQSASDDTFTNGTDVVIPNGGPESIMNVIVYKPRDFNLPIVYLSLGAEGKPSFMRSMFASLGGSRSLTILVKSQGTTDDGTLIFGEPRPNECSSWTQYSAFNSGYHEKVFYSKIVEIGSYRRSGLILTQFSTDYLAVDQTTYKAAVKQLNVVANEINCQETAEIIFDNDFKIGPEDYLRKVDNVCWFTLRESITGIVTLPLRLLYQRCLSYDFDKNTVSVGTLK